MEDTKDHMKVSTFMTFLIRKDSKTPILILQTFPQVKRFFYSAAPSNLCTINNDLIYHRGTDLLFAPQGRSLIQEGCLMF